MNHLVRGLGIAFAAALFASSSNASIITFDLHYSGAQFGNSAVATGTVAFDDAVLPNGPSNSANVLASFLGVVDWTLTVSGAGTGNGTFVLADLEPVTGQASGWIWVLNAPLDLTRELVGQAGFDDFNWCGFTSSCGNPLAPGGIMPFTIATSGETGDALLLTSMAPSGRVPAPSIVWLLGLGIATLGVRGKRWRVPNGFSTSSTRS